jgi:hypothetical protein
VGSHPSSRRLEVLGRASGPAAYLGLGGQRHRPCLALHRVGFAWPACRHAAGALLPHHFTLAGDGPHVRARRLGGVISVALSRGFPRVGSPDHPRPAVSGLSSRAGFLPDLPRLPDRPLDGRPLAARWPVPARRRSERLPRAVENQLSVEPQPPQRPASPRISIWPPQTGHGADPAARRPSQAPATTAPNVSLPPPAPARASLTSGRGRSSRRSAGSTGRRERASSSSRRACRRAAEPRRPPPRRRARSPVRARLGAVGALTRSSGTRRSPVRGSGHPPSGSAPSPHSPAGAAHGPSRGRTA